MELASDVGPVPLNVGALMVLDAPEDEAVGVASALAERAVRIPRLSQRLAVPVSPWRRPYWTDMPGIDLHGRVIIRRCSPPGDRQTLLADAVRLLTQPLPRSEPLWRATVLTGLEDRRCALVLVLHHVLADGIGGLAVLAALTDSLGSQPERTAPPARSASGRAPVRQRHGAGLVGALDTLRRGHQELGGGRPRRAPATSLNRPTGPRRVITSAHVDLPPLRSAARDAGATINDLLLVAATGAARDVLRSRGEYPPELVVSMPVSARATTDTHQLGNRVGVIPVRVPLAGTTQERIRAVADATAARRSADRRGTSAALVGPAFRALAATGLLRRFVDRQRLVNLFLTNVKGPPTPLAIGHARVTEMVPLTATQGNVALAFAALSYGDRLTVTAVLDPDVVGESDLLRGSLQAALDALTVPARSTYEGSPS